MFRNNFVGNCTKDAAFSCVERTRVWVLVARVRFCFNFSPLFSTSFVRSLCPHFQIRSRSSPRALRCISKLKQRTKRTWKAQLGVISLEISCKTSLSWSWYSFHVLLKFLCRFYHTPTKRGTATKSCTSTWSVQKIRGLFELRGSSWFQENPLHVARFEQINWLKRRFPIADSFICW